MVRIERHSMMIYLFKESVETIIKMEIMQYGPVLACFMVYEDFQHYHSGENNVFIDINSIKVSIDRLHSIDRMIVKNSMVIAQNSSVGEWPAMMRHHIGYI